MLEDYSQGQKLLLGLAVAVVGLVGLVIVTFVGAAVIGSFVLGMGGAEATAPQAQFGVEETSDGVHIVHEGGDPIDSGQLAVVVDGSARQAATYDGTGGDGTFDARESLAVTASSGSTVELVWTPADSEEETVLLSYEVA